jgi:hypothetical protein
MVRSSSRRRTAVRAAALVAALTALAAAGCFGGPEQRRNADGVSVGVGTDPSPAELGEQHFTFYVEADGKSVADADVRFRMHMPGMPMSTDDAWIPAESRGGGRYAGQGDFSMGGTWEVVVAVRRPGHDPVTVAFPFEIKWELK